MGLIKWIRELIGKMLKRDIQSKLNVDILISSKMEQAITLWENIYLKNPPWLSKKIKTIGFAKVIATETARLATLELDIAISGSARASYLQEQINEFKSKVRTYLEYACVYGGIILKPNGLGIDYISPKNFLPTHTDSNGEISGGIFLDCITKGNKHYTRLEYHRFVFIPPMESSVYQITNMAFVSDDENQIGKEIQLNSIPEWSGLSEEASIENIEKPLFSYLKMPMANGVDTHSPLGTSIFAEAIEELQTLDIAYSLNAREIKDSEKLVLLDDRVLNEAGKPIGAKSNDIELPHYVRNIHSTGVEDFYQEVSPKLNTADRIIGINQELSFIGYKCGYSNGYFRFEQGRGFITATQIEAEDKRTIETITDIRTALKVGIDNLLYALDKYADLYSITPFGTYEVSYYFKDITVSFTEDRQRYYNLAMAGKFPWKKYYIEYEGYSEDEAQELLDMLKVENKLPDLYDEE
jgi:A118 family predicted phage portal protein